MLLIFTSALTLFVSVSGLAAAKFTLWFAILPLLILVWKAPDAKIAFWRSWAAGAMFFLAHISWFLSATPLTWAGVETPVLSWTITAVIWLSSAAVLGLFTGLFGAALKRVPINYWWFAAPALFTFSEYLRAWGFGVWWLGKESLLGPHWTFGALGYSAVHFGPLLNSSKLAGLYGLSFTLAVPSVFLFYVFLQNHRGETSMVPAIEVSPLYKRAGAFLLFLAAAVVSFDFYSGYFRPPAPNPEKMKQVALIQSNFPPELWFSPVSFSTRAQTNWENAKKVKSENPDLELIVLPEGSLVTNLWREDAARMLKDLAGENKPLTLIDAAKVEFNRPSPVRVYHITSERGLEDYSDKRFLIPGGEYLSYWGLLFADLFGAREWLNQYSASHEITRGIGPAEELGRKQENGALVCSAVLSPNLYHTLTRNGAGVLINTTSLSIFKGNPLFLAQSEAMLRFIAASADRFMLQAANGGMNYIINNRGEVVAKSAGLGFEPLVGEVEYRYTRVWITSY